MTIVIRPHLLGRERHELDWWDADRMVDVMVGNDDHAGRLLIRSGTTHRLRKTGGKAKPGVNLPVMLMLPLLEGITPGKQRPTAIRHELGDNWIEVGLATWATPTAAADTSAAEAPAAAPKVAPAPVAARAPAAPSAPAPATPVRERYQGISERMPDPAAQRRAAGRSLGSPGGDAGG